MLPTLFGRVRSIIYCFLSHSTQKRTVWWSWWSLLWSDRKQEESSKKKGTFTHVTCIITYLIIGRLLFSIYSIYSMFANFSAVFRWFCAHFLCFVWKKTWFHALPKIDSKKQSNRNRCCLNNSRQYFHLYLLFVPFIASYQIQCVRFFSSFVLWEWKQDAPNRQINNKYLHVLWCILHFTRAIWSFCLFSSSLALLIPLPLFHVCFWKWWFYHCLLLLLPLQCLG